METSFQPILTKVASTLGTPLALLKYRDDRAADYRAFHDSGQSDKKNRDAAEEYAALHCQLFFELPALLGCVDRALDLAVVRLSTVQSRYYHESRQSILQFFNSWSGDNKFLIVDGAEICRIHRRASRQSTMQLNSLSASDHGSHRELVVGKPRSGSHITARHPAGEDQSNRARAYSASVTSGSLPHQLDIIQQTRHPGGLRSAVSHEFGNKIAARSPDM